MKTQLLTMAAMAWAASAMAGDWELPVAPSESDAVQIEDGGHYYATPVGSGQFLCGSNSWGTQASLKPEGYEVVLYHSVPLGDPNSIDDTWSISFPVIAMGVKDYAGDFMFVESDVNSIFCNAYNGSTKTELQSNRNRIHYVFTPNADGQTYRFRSVYADETVFLGWDGVELGEKNFPVIRHLDPDEVAEKPVVDEDGFETGEMEDVSPLVDWAFIPAPLYAAYEAKLKLYDKLNEAEEAGVTELADVVAVYNDPNATADDILPLIDVLTERMMNQGGDGEVDVTSYIKNPDCAADEGWSGFNNQNSHCEGVDGANIDGRFFEMWTPNNGGSGRLADATLVQTVTLPAGKYRLQADVIASQQSDNSIEVEGVYLYADGGPGLYSESEPIYTDNGVPQTISVEFACTSEAKIGLKIRETNANWVAVDNFKLFFLGYIDNPNEIALNGIIPTLEEYADETFSAATKSELEALISKCQAALGSSEEAMGDMVAEAEAFIETVEAEIEAYKKLAAFVEQLKADADEYSEYGTFGDWLGDYVGTVQDHYSDGDLSVEEIDEMIAAYDQQVEDGVREFIASEAKPGTDVSVLIKNRDMDEGDHWVNTKGNPQIPGWNPESTSPWGYDKSAGEFWNMDFDFYQDIEGLPEGKYTVSFQGFYRWGNPQDVVDAYDPDVENDPMLTAVLYGNSVETTFKSICDGRVSDVSGWAVECGVDDEGNTCYIPNSMEQAQWVFTNHPELYHTEASALVGEDGHLRIGIKGQSDIGNRWVIFDSFRLRYDGNDANMYFEDMQKQVAALVAKRDRNLSAHSLPQDIYNAVDELEVKCGELVANSATTKDDCQAFFEAINAVSAKMEEANAIINDIISEAGYYELAMNEEWWPTELIGDEWNEIYETVYLISSGDVSECVWDTFDDLKAMAENFSGYFVADVFKAAPADVTEKNPYDMTVVIRNPQMYDWSEYDGENGDGVDDAVSGALDQWKGSGSAKRQCGLAEFWNTNFNMYQTIVNLPVGYYAYEVDGFYRCGGLADAALHNALGDEELAAKMYVVQGTDTIASTPFMSICEGALEPVFDEYGEMMEIIGAVEVAPDEENGLTDSVTYYLPNTQAAARQAMNAGRYKGNKVVFHSDGTSATIGIKKDVLKGGDWTIFDNFQLYYLGQTAPDAIEQISGTAFGAGVKQSIFTVGGVQVARPQRGVNIVVTTLSDGTKVTSKVLVK